MSEATTTKKAKKANKTKKEDDKQKNKIASTIFEYCLILLMIAFIIVCIVFIKAPAQNKRTFIVSSGSMEPLMPIGTLVKVSPISDPSELKVDDIITFEAVYPNTNGKKVVVTHRIIAIKYEYGRYIFLTKGDASPGADPFNVPFKDIIGKYESHTPLFFGKILVFFNSVYGLFFLVMTLMWLILYHLVFSTAEKIIIAKEKAELARIDQELYESELEKAELITDFEIIGIHHHHHKL